MHLHRAPFRKADKIKALESLDKVGILDKAYMRADQLSGGQQQRVALARTLTQNPRIILADEPVAALDPVTAKQVMQDFVRINKELGISILLNIHHVELALEYAERIIGIRAGKIVYDGPSALSLIHSSGPGTAIAALSRCTPTSLWRWARSTSSSSSTP